MRVNIDEIKEAGLVRTWDISREQVDEYVAGDQAGYRGRAPAHLEAKLEKIERRVRVAVHGTAPVTVACGRCLGPVAVDVPVDFDLTLVPADEYADPSSSAADSGRVAGSFEPTTAEEEAYTGKVVDLDPIVGEQIALALPSYPVCNESCKGLCPACGANLNERDCGCDRHVPDPRWAGLKNLKLG